MKSGSKPYVLECVIINPVASPGRQRGNCTRVALQCSFVVVRYNDEKRVDSWRGKRVRWTGPVSPPCCVMLTGTCQLIIFYFGAYLKKFKVLGNGEHDMIKRGPRDVSIAQTGERCVVERPQSVGTKASSARGKIFVSYPR